MLSTYYRLAKPGIVYGNLLPVIAGFFLASQGRINLSLLIETIVGISLVMASGCVFNNIIDRDVDAKMARTRRRATVTGEITTAQALRYGSALGLLGFICLLAFTTLLTSTVAAAGLIFYVVLYGWGKRNTVHGTLIGAVAGAVPPVVGYCAVSNSIDLGAALLFSALIFWQMPHFYAIAIYRASDYKAAGLPVLPVKYGVRAAKQQILAYVVGFSIISLLFWTENYTAYTYLLVMLGVDAWWLLKALRGFRTKHDAAWARNMFFSSLVVLTVFCAMLSIDWWLP